MNTANHERFIEIAAILPEPLGNLLRNTDGRTQSHVREIRLRTGQPLYFHMGDKGCFITKEAKVSYLPSEDCFVPDAQLLRVESHSSCKSR